MTEPADQGLQLRQAALVVGIALLIMIIAAPFAELYAYPTLIIPDDIEQTIANIQANRMLFLAGVFANLITYICDVLVAWGLYVLLAPVNRSLSLVTAWFQLVYTAVAVVALMKLAVVFRLLDGPTALSVLGADALNAQVYTLLVSSRYEWGFALIFFGVHLLLAGYLAYRADYIPRVLGVLLALAGAGYVVFNIGLYVAPDVDLGLLVITFLGEPVFMLWLLFRGWRIPEPGGHAAPPSAP